MVNLFGTHLVSGDKRVVLTSKTKFHASASDSSKVLKMSDKNERSIVNKLTAKIKKEAPIRMDLIQRVKAEIAAGEYETPKRIEGTIDKLMEEIFPEYF
jgi:anti-sigma28 factor (negative regulator of flagellin synthesis)